jgi:peptide/nickel transport system permease protein
MTVFTRLLARRPVRLRGAVVLGPVTILLAVAICAIAAPWIAPYDPAFGSIGDRLAPPAWADGGSGEHLLGTDANGRDILSRLIHGARVSILLGVLCVLVSGVLGTAVGLAAGYFRGLVDNLLMRITDIVFSLPLILMGIVLVSLLGNSLRNVVIVVALLLWPYYARQVRAETLVLREQDFVALARVGGCSHVRIMLRYLLPSLLPSLLVLGSTQIAGVILLEASLSFLGLGLPPTTAAWGLMVADGRTVLDVAWWVSFFPGLAIALTVFSITLLGDWLRDRLDPRLRGVR